MNKNITQKTANVIKKIEDIFEKIAIIVSFIILGCLSLTFMFGIVTFTLRLWYL